MKSTSNLLTIGLAAVALGLSACGAPQGAGEGPGVGPATETFSPEASGSAGSASAQPTGELGSGTFAEYSEGAVAVTYNPSRVPEGSSAQVDLEEAEDSTTVSLSVKGLEPDMMYGAHVHVGACGEDPDDAGPHYQNEQDPETPSTNPQYANPENEIWLDFSTDPEGNAEAQSSVGWQLREGEGRSVVIHTMHTKTEEGEAGTAGDRLACITIR